MEKGQDATDFIQQKSFPDRIDSICGDLINQAAAIETLSFLFLRLDDQDLCGMSDLLCNVSDKISLAIERLEFVCMDMCRGGGTGGSI